MKTKALHPKWILVARIGWLSITLFFLTTFILGLPYRYKELVTACDASVCPPLTLSGPNAALIESTIFSMQGYASFHIGVELFTALIMTVMAGLIFWKYFDNLMGILTAYLMSYIGLTGFVQASKAFAVHYPLIEWIDNQLFVLFPSFILLVGFIFPNGRFLNKLSRSICIFSILFSILDPILIQNGINIMGETGSFLFFVTVAIGIWSQIYRYRNISGPIEKQQTKWVLLGIISLICCIVGWVLFIETFAPSTPRSLLITNTLGIAFIFLLGYIFPISLMVAIMRYGLWDIDIIIRRTVKYALVTAVLLLVYFGSVTLLQSALAGLTDSQSPIVIVLSTLLIAALFNPLRRRVQAFIDRRFYRRKYDAAQMLAQFAATARDEVDVERLSAVLLGVVEESIQPEEISLWLKKPGDKRLT